METEQCTAPSQKKNNLCNFTMTYRNDLSFCFGKDKLPDKKVCFSQKKHYKFWGIRNTFWSLLKNNILADDPKFPIFHLNNNNNPITVCLSPSYTLHIKLPLPFIFKTIWWLNEVLKSQTWYWHVELQHEDKCMFDKEKGSKHKQTDEVQKKEKAPFLGCLLSSCRCTRCDCTDFSWG